MIKNISKSTLLQILALGFLFSISACSKQIEKKGFISRIHLSNCDMDWYKLLGVTTFSKHVVDFNKIDWEKLYWDEWNSGEFNLPDLEAFDTINMLYLAISIAPENDTICQFEAFWGTHETVSENDTLNIERTCKYYGSETMDKKRIVKLFEYFFNRDYTNLQRELDKMFYLQELNDVYFNYPGIYNLDSLLMSFEQTY
jgi:hypothetical protein